MNAPAGVEEYLAALPQEARAALERLRKAIKAAAPDATEAISYRLPAFKDHGRSLVAYGGFKDHCSFFPMSTKVIDDHMDELRPFYAGKGTLRFTADKPLPAALVKRLVKERLAENAAADSR
ncbi:MAG TPA: DUF1801 domain-containing protein [Acidimicrobiia bacterium]|nr:DUF1801 domain-containing protein [Acidimicrobiia bacterium]